MASAAVLGPVEKLDQILNQLDVISADEKSEKLQKLANEATRATYKFRNEMKRSHVEQMVNEVHSAEWGEYDFCDKSIKEKMQKYFPGIYDNYDSQLLQ